MILKPILEFQKISNNLLVIKKNNIKKNISIVGGENKIKNKNNNVTEKKNKAGDDNDWEFIPTVELGRGGGWRDENGKVHPLGHFSLSQEMPMMIHSLTPLEEKEQTNYMFEDWTKLGEKDEA